MTCQTRNDRRGPATRYPVLAIAGFSLALACPASAQHMARADDPADQSRAAAPGEADLRAHVDTARSELARWTGKVPVWTSGTVHPVATVAWFLDAGRTVQGGEVRPGAAFAPLGFGDGDIVIEDGAVMVRLTGWQRVDAPHLLHAGPGAGVLRATLGSEAQEARATGAPVVLPLSGESWQPVEVHGWIAEADLTARPDALWGLAEALRAAACPRCEAAPLDASDAGAWSERLEAELSSTGLPPDEARLVTAYLQSSAAESPGAGDHAMAAMGQLLYDQHCWACHGEDAREGSGGDIRGSDFRAVRNAVGGYETMPQIVLAEDEMSAVAAYLTALADGS